MQYVPVAKFEDYYGSLVDLGRVSCLEDNHKPVPRAIQTLSSRSQSFFFAFCTIIIIISVWRTFSTAIDP